MPRLHPTSDVGCYRESLFGPWESHSPSVEKPKPRPKPAKKLRVSRYGGSQGRGDVGQQVATVREVILARFDDIGATRLWPIAEAAGVKHPAFLRMFQEMLLCLFPDECGDGEPYMPDPAHRMQMPPVTYPDGKPIKLRPGGLLPHPCEGVGDERAAAFAEHCLNVGRASPLAGMTTTAKDQHGNAVTVPLFTEADLVRLGERIERRGADRSA